MKHSFECLVNVSNDQTHCDSITSSATETVVGVPMIGHDMFHQVANNLVKISLLNEPDLKTDYELYDINLGNPAGFNYNGERLAMIAQNYIKAFSVDNINGKKILKSTNSNIPNYNNINKLASLLSFDIKTSFSLGLHGFRHDFQDNLMIIFIEPSLLLSLAFEFIESRCSSIYTLFMHFYYAKQQHFPHYEDNFFDNLKRYVGDSIDEIELLHMVNIHSNINNCKTLLANYLVNQIIDYASYYSVKNQIINDFRLYTFYMETDNKYFSLNQDIVDYYQHNYQSKAFKLLEFEFLSASSMSWKTYLNGSRFVAGIFDSIYLSDFISQELQVVNDQIIITTNSKMSLLESDMNKYTNCCQALNSYKVTDYIAKTGIGADTSRLKNLYNSIVGPLTDKIKNLTTNFENRILPFEEYKNYYSTLKALNLELKTLKLHPSTLLVTDQLIKYYGYCDL